MMSRRQLQPLDVVTGVISGTLAVAFLSLGALAALPDDSSDPVVVEPAVAHP